MIGRVALYGVVTRPLGHGGYATYTPLVGTRCTTHQVSLGVELGESRTDIFLYGTYVYWFGDEGFDMDPDSEEDDHRDFQAEFARFGVGVRF